MTTTPIVGKSRILITPDHGRRAANPKLQICLWSDVDRSDMRRHMFLVESNIACLLSG